MSSFVIPSYCLLIVSHYRLEAPLKSILGHVESLHESPFLRIMKVVHPRGQEPSYICSFKSALPNLPVKITSVCSTQFCCYISAFQCSMLILLWSVNYLISCICFIITNLGSNCYDCVLLELAILGFLIWINAYYGID